MNNPDKHTNSERQKILIVDDKAANLFALKKVLQNTDADIVESLSGQEALAAVLEHDFSLMILDIQMPEMDGYELAGHLRGDPKTQDVPIIFLTANHPDETSIFKGYKVGAIDYITKPYLPEILTEKVRALLEMEAVRQELKRSREGLEELVKARTQELEDSNRELDAARLAALNIMEDALLSKTQTQRDAAVQKAVAEVLRSNISDLPKLLNRTLEQAIQLTESKIGYIYFYDKVKKEFTLNAWSKDVMPECSIADPQTCYELDKTGLWGEAVRQRKPILVNNYPATHPLKKGTPAGHVAMKNFLTVPVFQGEDIVAVAGVANKPSDYTEQDILTLQLLVDSAWKSAESIKATEALCKSEARQGKMVANIGDVIVIVDQDGITRYKSPNVEKWFGWVPEDLVGNDIWGNIHPDDLASTQRSFSELMEAPKASRTLECRYRCKDGSYKWIEMTATNLLHDPDIYGILGNYHDITERKQAEKQIKENASRFQKWMRESFIGVLVTTADGDIYEANDSFLSIIGYTREDLTEGRLDWKVLTPPEYAHLDKTALIEADGKGFCTPYEKVYIHKDGRRVPITVGFSQQRDPSGEFLVFIVDNTERKRLEEALEKRVLALTRPLDDSSEIAIEELFHLEEIQQIQDDFSTATGVASIITHPDGTPITNPSNFTRLCSDVIRKTEKGCANCFKSDAVLGRHHPDGPVIQPCLSGGLWDAGASIEVGGRHIANWLIGQVRDETQTDEPMLAYAKEIGADETDFMNAFHEIPVMSHEHFKQIAHALYTLAKQLSTSAYQNMQQARFISDQKKAEEDLRESEHRIRTWLTNSPVCTKILDLDFNLQYMSAAGIHSLGIDDVTTLYGHPYPFDFYPDSFNTPMVANLEKAKATGKTLTQEAPIVDPKGNKIWFHSTIVPVKDDASRVEYMMVISMDTTKRNRAANELRESEERFKSLHNASFGGIAIHDQGIILECNRGLSIISGYSQEELIGMNGLELIAPETRDLVFKQIQVGYEKPYETTGLRKNGETYPLRLEARNVLYKGTNSRTVEFRDITEQKKAEAELRRLSTAIEQSPESVMITDPDGIIQYVNPAFETMTGYTAEEATGETPHLLKSGEHSDTFYSTLWETIRSGKTWEGRLVNKRKDGSVYTEEASISPVRNPAGDITGYVAIKRDITEELEREEQMQQAQKMEAIGQLAGGIAHDFNNILQAILGFSELLLPTVAKEERARNNVLEIQKAAQHAAELTKQLLAFSRKQPAKLTTLDLNTIITGTQQILTSIIGENVHIHTDLSPELDLIRADEQQVERVIINLSINARDAMPTGGELTFRTENVRFPAAEATAPQAREGSFICLSVSDTGTGMPKETMQHIFEPFFSTKAPGKGTGLGLASIYGIVQKHLGWIDVDSELGVGSTFKIYLPIHSDEILADENADQTEIPDHVHGRGERILIVEDDPSILTLSETALKNTGYTVKTAMTAEAAEQLFTAEKGNFDLLFSDIILSDKNGVDLAKSLLEKKPDLQILLCSGYSGDHLQQMDINKKNIFFLEKPFSIVNLLKVIQQALTSNK